MGPNKDRESTY